MSSPVEVPPRGAWATGQQGTSRAVATIRAEAARMAQHAERLNAALHHGYAEQYLPDLFRPEQIERALPDVVELLGSNQFLENALSDLRAAATAADAEAERLLVGGGDARRLTRLVQRTLNSAVTVVRAIDQLRK